MPLIVHGRPCRRMDDWVLSLRWISYPSRDKSGRPARSVQSGRRFWRVRSVESCNNLINCLTFSCLSLNFYFYLELLSCLSAELGLLKEVVDELQWRSVGYRRPGRAAILPPQNVVISSILPLFPQFLSLSPPFCRPLLTTPSLRYWWTVMKFRKGKPLTQTRTDGQTDRRQHDANSRVYVEWLAAHVSHITSVGSFQIRQIHLKLRSLSYEAAHALVLVLVLVHCRLDCCNAVLTCQRSVVTGGSSPVRSALCCWRCRPIEEYDRLKMKQKS